MIITSVPAPLPAQDQPTPRITGPGFFHSRPLEALNASASSAEARALATAIASSAQGVSDAQVAEVFEAFAAERPKSAWTPALLDGLATYYFEDGRYTMALANWEKALELVRGHPTGPGRRIADRVLADWTTALLQLGRTEEYEAVLADLNGRRPGGGAALQKFLRGREIYGMLKHRPSLFYRCGWMVLNELSLSTRQQGLEGITPQELYQEANLFDSCSFKRLAQIAGAEKWRLAGVERPQGVADLPVPSVMHLTQGHYIALLYQEGARVFAYDPLWGSRFFNISALNQEGSGRFLVQADQVPTGWRSLSDAELTATLGRSQWYNGMPDPQDSWCDSCECGPPGIGGANAGSGGNRGGGPEPTPDSPAQSSGNGCSTCGSSQTAPSGQGMVEWRVSEPNVNLWLHDAPISCQPAYGPAVSFELMYKQRDESGQIDRGFSFSEAWNSPWLSYLDPSLYLRYQQPIVAYLPGGGVVSFAFGAGQTVSRDYNYNGRLTVNGDGTYTLDFPDGRQCVYSQSQGDLQYMTAYADAKGFVTHFVYTTSPYTGLLRIDTVTDHAGQLLYQLGYANSGSHPDLVTSVTDRFNRAAQLGYVFNGNGYPFLQSITDAQGLTSLISYDSSTCWPQTLVTPYGQTSFAFQFIDNPPNSTAYRWVRVTEPNGGRQIVAFKDDCTTLWSGSAWLGANFPAGTIPGNLPGTPQLDTASQCYRNSFWWNQKQSVNISENLASLTAADMRKARWRHWLDDGHGGTPVLGLAVEVAPSPDTSGSTLGQITWFDQAGKPSGQPDVRGTQILPALEARKLPDGSTWYRSYERNSFGKPTSMTETYGTGNPAATRTFTYTYEANGQDLSGVYRPGNQLVASYTHNTRHQVLTATRYPDSTHSYTDTWTYDSQGRLSTYTSAAGLTRTYTNTASCNGYGGYLSGFGDSPVVRRESFTWATGGYVRTHTDARGLTRTFTRDGLGRLTQIDYPAHDGLAASSIQYSYTLLNGHGFNNSGNPISILDLTQVTDRRGRTTYYDRDQLGRVTLIRDPLNHTTQYTYCGCGSPETITDGRNKVTTFAYNNAGWKTGVVYGDNTSESFGYDALGRVTSRTDSLGTRTFYYNNQGLLIQTDNAYGAESSTTYDIYDTAVTVVDAKGVSTTQTFDWLGRISTRAVPGQQTESFGYTARGLTSYTGPDGRTTQYNYDEAQRKTSETTPKNEVIQFAYNAAGDLRTLTDGRTKTTLWTNDVEGLVRGKQYHGQSFTNLVYAYDVNGRLTSRTFWLDGSTSRQTLYGYDDAGNLTSVDYPSSPDVSFTYNAVNKLATMTTTGLGTTTFTYNDAELPTGESGLWPSDAVSYSYHASAPRLRAGLTVQQPSGSMSQTYGYDAADRLQTITAPAGSFTYTYKGAGTLWTNLALPTSPASAITNGYDAAGRMLRTALRSSSGSILDSQSYTYNTYGQRQRMTLTDNSYTTYGYDYDSQLTSALGYTSGGVPIAAQQLGFGYDPGWNMTNRSVNGTPSAYTINDRNAITAGPDSGYGYDGNGNLTSLGTGSATVYYTYDDENQLSSVTWGSGAYRTEMTYDGLRRLRKRVEKFLSGGAWTTISETRYCYDGNRVVQERNSSNTPTVAYTRGLDLSGALEGAGGIGGLLARSHGYSAGTWSTHHFYHADASGNITALMDSAQALSASYRYDAFGRTISSSGSMASPNVYRFSSKEWIYDGAGGYYYYLYRFYDPKLQRWLNRDPIGEDGGANLYRYAANRPSSVIDPWGWSDINAPPGSVTGPNPGFPSPNPLLPGPGQVPPGYDPGWPTGVDPRGPYIQDPKSGTKYYPHPEDKFHWPHYDDDKGGSYPDKCLKPRPGQKRRPYGKQSPVNPWLPPAPTRTYTLLPKTAPDGTPILVVVPVPVVGPGLLGPVLVTPGVPGLPTYPVVYPIVEPIFVDPVLVP